MAQTFPAIELLVYKSISHFQEGANISEIEGPKPPLQIPYVVIVIAYLIPFNFFKFLPTPEIPDPPLEAYLYYFYKTTYHTIA